MDGTTNRFAKGLALLALPGVLSCGTVDEEDAGDEAFVAWATVAVLGRRPYSTTEVRVLSDIAATKGREAVLDLLMTEPDFVPYWQSVLMEDFEVAIKNEGGSFDPQRIEDGTCYSEALVSPLFDWLLTDHLTTHDPTEPFDIGLPDPIPFTMADVFRASLRKDRLDALYIAHFGPLTYQTRDDGVNQFKFMDVYLDRDVGCLECHGVEYSTSNPRPLNGNWDRFFPAATVDLEGQMFSWTDGGGGFHHYSRPDIRFYERLFVEENRAPQGTGGVNLFGIDDRCMTLVEGAAVSVGVREVVDADGTTGLAGDYRADHNWIDLALKLQDGITTWHTGAATCQVAPGPDPSPGVAAPDCVGNEGVSASAFGEGVANGYCADCHTTNPEAPDLEQVTSTMSTSRIMRIVQEGSVSGVMEPSQYGNEMDALAIASYFASLPGYQGDRQYENPNHALGHLVAMSVADTIYENISGASLTLDHGFSRNFEAATGLELLAHELAGTQWSLKHLIKLIALSEGANRPSPDASSLQPYMLPMAANPWAATVWETPNHATGENTNGQGDLVHRWPIASLIRQRNTALLWPQADYFDDVDTKERMGHYAYFGNEGFDGVQLDAFLAWESDNALCAKPDGVTDYIDELLAANISYEAAFRAIKGRLVSDNRFWSAERPLLQSMFEIKLDGIATSEDALRRYCGTVLASPQFMLAGLPVWDEGEEVSTPPASPCVDDLCTYEDFCEHYAESAEQHGIFEGYECEANPGGFSW